MRENRPMLSHRLCTAPMMDWSDRHCRYFFRQLSPHAVVYSEMITTGALVHGDLPRHLDFDPAEHPVALQLGGSEPADLAHCARLGERWGYDEINLNCGCPSQRVQRGAFGACLMAEPELVADCVKAMQDAVSVPVTVKHRLGLPRSLQDEDEDGADVERREDDGEDERPLGHVVAPGLGGTVVVIRHDRGLRSGQWGRAFT